MANSGTNIAQAYVQIIPSAQGIAGSISSAISGEASSAGTSSGTTLGKKLAAAAVGAISGAAIGKAIGSSITEGSNLQQSIGGIETLFKDSASKVEEYASKAFQTTGMSANTYMENVTGFSASLLQGMGGDTSKAADVANTAMTDMSDNANKMGTSIDSITYAYQGFAKQNYTMLDNLKLGYGGSAEEMARLVNDTKVMGDGVEYTAKTVKDVPFDKIIEAIHSAQTELGITGTTAKEASTTFSGSFSMMKASWQDFLGNLALGNDMTEPMQNLMDSVSNFLTNNFFPMLKNILDQLPTVIGNFSTMIQPYLPDLVNAAVQIITALITGLIQNLPLLINGIGQIFTAVIGALSQLDWGAIGSEVMTAIGNAFQTNAPATIAIFAGIGLMLVNSLAPAVSGISTVFGGIASKLGGLGSAASSAAAPISSASSSVGSLSQNALGIVAVGAGILLAAVGLALLAQSAIAISQAGPGAAVAMVLMIAAIAAMALGAAALAPALTAGAVGLVAFGAGVALVGAGIFLATAGVALLATQLPTIVTFGAPAAMVIAKIGAALLAFAPGALAAGAATGVLAAGFAAGTIAIAAFLAATALTVIGVAALDAAMLILAATVAGIAGSASSASNSLQTMVGAVDVVQTGLDALGDIATDVIGAIASVFQDSAPNIQQAALLLVTGVNTSIVAGSAMINASLVMINVIVSQQMQKMQNTIKSSLVQIMSAFANTKLQFRQSNIVLPHFSMSGAFDPKTKEVPTVKVSWYQSAMESGIILNGATIFGASGNTLLGGGEAGSEAVIGVRTLDGLIRSSVSSGIQNGIDSGNASNGGDTIIPVYIGNEQIDRIVVTANKRNALRSGGR